MDLNTNPITMGWAATSPYPLSSTNEMLAAKPPSMLIEKVLPRAGVMGITAVPGAGKTWLALEMARAVSKGVPFLGRYPTQRGGVLFVGSDSSLFDYARQWARLTYDDRVEHRRLLDDMNEYDENGNLLYEPAVDDMIEAFGPDWQNAPFDSVRFLIQSSFYFGNSDETKRLIQTAKAFHWGPIKDTPNGPEYSHGLDLIVFDTLSRLSRANQNDNTEMEEVFRHVRIIAEATNAAVVLLHHNSKRTEFNDGADWRGAMSQIGALDSWIQLSPGQNDRYKVGVQFKKFRGITPPDFAFKMEVMEEDYARLIAIDAADQADANVSDVELALRALLAKDEAKDGLTMPEIVDRMWPEFGTEGDGVGAFKEKRKLYTYLSNRLASGKPLRKLVGKSKNEAGRIVYTLINEQETA